MRDIGLQVSIQTGQRCEFAMTPDQGIRDLVFVSKLKDLFLRCASFFQPVHVSEDLTLDAQGARVSAHDTSNRGRVFLDHVESLLKPTLFSQTLSQ